MISIQKGGNMKNNRISAEKLGFNLDEISKQKVTRSTFRLSPEAHQIIADMCKRRGIKKTDLFERLSKLIEDNILGNSVSSGETNRGIRKTYVVKKGTLNTLDSVARERKKSRDSIIENAVIQLKQIIKGENEKYQKVQEKIIRPFYEYAQKIEDKLQKELNNHNNPIVRRFSIIVTELMSLDIDIEHFLKDGIPVDPE